MAALRFFRSFTARWLVAVTVVLLGFAAASDALAVGNSDIDFRSGQVADEAASPQLEAYDARGGCQAALVPHGGLCQHAGCASLPDAYAGANRSRAALPASTITSDLLAGQSLPPPLGPPRQSA
jgi:hypothetical protein